VSFRVAGRLVAAPPHSACGRIWHAESNSLGVIPACAGTTIFMRKSARKKSAPQNDIDFTCSCRQISVHFAMNDPEATRGIAAA
jgi:hypothetical protein